MSNAARIPWYAAALVIATVVVMPWVGALAAGRTLAGLFQLPPPLTLPSGYRSFSWAAASGVVAALLVLIVAWSTGSRSPTAKSAGRPAGASLHVTRRTGFPWWGVVAVAWTLLWWVLAWTRIPAAASVQRFTFFPLWLGFIVTTNAVVHWRAGTCLMTRDPHRWMLLFVASAGFWWVFEWLNRFVLNWHYVGVFGLGPGAYALHATLSFSTVLPAVCAVAELLGTGAKWQTRTSAGPEWRWIGWRVTGGVLIVFGCSALALTGALPLWFYPALWVAPLALVLGVEIIGRFGGISQELVAGDWSRVVTWMLAAAVCGFFWEMWNLHSFAKWVYTVPGVERWFIFEMPLLGYAGYLPFGLECLVVADRLGIRGRD